jgi:hypothetical protein
MGRYHLRAYPERTPVGLESLYSYICGGPCLGASSLINNMEEKKIKIEEFVDFILTRMDAKEALMRLLATQISHYEKLKLEKQPEDNPEQISPYMILIAATLDLGWNFAIETGDNSKVVRGLCVGTEDYLNTIFKNEQDKTKDPKMEEGS